MNETNSLLFSKHECSTQASWHRIKRAWGHACRSFKYWGVGAPRFPTWQELVKFIDNYMIAMNFVIPVLNITKKKRIQSKQLINGTRYLRDSHFSIKIWENWGGWVNEADLALWVVNDLKLGQSQNLFFLNVEILFFFLFLFEFLAGFKVNDIEVHIYDLDANRKHIWEDHVSVWEVYCGFTDNETMIQAAESIRDRWSFKKGLTRKQYDLYEGQARFKVLSWDIDVGKYLKCL